MGAEVKYYLRIPVPAYRFIETYAVTAQEALDQHPMAVEALDEYQYEAREKLLNGDTE